MTEQLLRVSRITHKALHSHKTHRAVMVGVMASHITHSIILSISASSIPELVGALCAIFVVMEHVTDEHL